jgi:YegS/Rv2252/BmrU family lipid kinase
MGRKLRSEIERELTARGLHFTLAETERPWHAVELAGAAAEAGADVVVAAGGDGTIHEVANGLLQARTERRVALGVIPVGTGNDFAKLLETGTNRARAYDLLASGRVRDLDVGYVTWAGGAEYFINGMGTGVDVEVIRQVKRLPRMNGTLAYLIGLLRAVVGFKAVPLKVRADGRQLDRRVMIIAIGNGPCLGGGFWLTPRAQADDGLLDICLVDDLSYLQIVRYIPRVMRGTHEHLPVVKMDQAENIELEAPQSAAFFFHMDGELRELTDTRRLRIELIRTALPVVGARAGVHAPAARPAQSAEGGR